MSARIYCNHEITVYWKPHLCQHSAICLKSLPRVFKPDNTPWIDLQGAPTAQIIATIRRCPSGALSYSKK